jgi:hypothetical protein
MPAAGDPKSMRARANRRESTRLQRDSVVHLRAAKEADNEASRLLRDIAALESDLASLFLQLAGTDDDHDDRISATRNVGAARVGRERISR